MYAVGEYGSQNVSSHLSNQFTPNLSRKTSIYVIYIVKGSIPSEAKIFARRKGALRDRLHDYFEKISTEEFTHPPIPQLPPTHGPVLITVEETEAALKQLKSGKATSPDDVAVELWKSKC
ncbi:hypothetical protein Y032_0338g2933 [Ancylostoma ceylanicum]|uniref:Uncharacterized protein n=1 Tax=Ancylostoma ceylanicum TaxID=53326 RepID=A0A016RY63_9BILA|nr:hypothetical protein Y032_0338g2933 [Ancylostoma ceylanicum]